MLKLPFSLSDCPLGLFGAKLALKTSCWRRVCKALKLPFSLSDCSLGLFGARLVLKTYCWRRVCEVFNCSVDFPTVY